MLRLLPTKEADDYGQSWPPAVRRIWPSAAIDDALNERPLAG